MEEYFTLKNGGQFAPAQRGQFTSAQRGQLQSAKRGQYHRLFQVCYRIVRKTDTLIESDAHSNLKCFRLLPYLIVPSAFSPNGDNINDVFQIRGYGIRKFHIEIYNRWGELIFESDDPNFIWDGVYEGQKVMEGVFYIKINCLGNGKNLNKNFILHLLN